MPDVTGLELPASLIDSVNRDRNPERRAWLAALPGILGRLARQWGLRLETPFQPGGDCSWVGPVRAMDGRQLVLKAGWLHAEAMHEADALRCWDHRGAVAVYAEDVFDDTIALLLERCMPGTPLRQVPEPEQDAIVCTLLRRLWRAPPAGHAFPSLQAMCDRWADRFDQQASRAAQRLDPGIARAGMELFRTLPATAGEHVLLVTDLHAGNILAAQRDPWLAIDPKPHVGDPSYDPLQHMLNCAGRLCTDPVRFAQRLAGLLELDASRLLLWLFARCVQESPGNPDLARVAALLAP